MSQKSIKCVVDQRKEVFPFGKCMLDLMGHDSVHEMSIIVKETDDDIEITPSEDGIPFMHSLTCPIRQYFDRSKLHGTHIGLAVAALLENTDTKEVMITKRPKHMRSFPSTWVVPGGGHDGKESLVQTLHREILEEVGLDVSGAEYVPFFAWESCYPVFLELGMPKKQHFVIYYLVKLNNQLLKGQSITPQKIEVDSVAWIGKDIVSKSLSIDIEHTDAFSGIQLVNDEYVEKSFRINEELQSIDLTHENIVDHARLTTGTYYLLKHWMNQK